MAKQLATRAALDFCGVEKLLLPMPEIPAPPSQSFTLEPTALPANQEANGQASEEENHHSDEAHHDPSQPRGKRSF